MPKKYRPNEIIFMLVQGIWQDISDDNGTLAEYLQKHNIIIDDDCTFARIRRYNEKTKQYTVYEYRAYTGSTIRISKNIYDYV